MASITQTVTYVQHQPQQFVTHHVHHVKPPRIYRLPEEMKIKSFHLSISVLVNGLLCLLWGCIGYAIAEYRLFILSTGINIVCGVFFTLAGIFGITTFKNTANPHLMHSYYAFIILGFIAAIFQAIFSGISYEDIHLFRNGLVYTIISTILSLISLCQSLAGLIILSHHVYCKDCCYATGEATIHPTQPGQVQVINAYGPPQPLMMAPVNMPVNGVVYYNGGAAPNAGGPQVHFAQQPPPQPQPPTQESPPLQESRQEQAYRQFQPLPAIKK